MPSHAPDFINVPSDTLYGTSAPATPVRGRSAEPVQRLSPSGASAGPQRALNRRHTSDGTPTRSGSPSERTPLLSSSDDAVSAIAGTAWNDSVKRLKRRSARLSDLLSRGAHSAFATPGGIDEVEEEYEEDRRSIFSGARLLDGYDGQFKRELESTGGAGIRVWYENFHGIDWLHDQLKNGLRMKRLRKRKQTDGLRGQLVNMWDAAQGWVLVTIIGAVTAVIAFGIIRAEGLLFDLKDGYCTRGVLRSKRFCCPPQPPNAPGKLSMASSLWKSLPPKGASNGFVQTWQTSRKCSHWITWAEAVDARSASGRWFAEHAIYVSLALLFAGTASALTIYLTASTSVFSSKDSPSAPYPGFDPSLPVGKECASTLHQVQPAARKTMYFAAGSGIPEIKAILAGLVIRGYLGTWTLMTKAVGLSLSVASGLSLGKEGPFVHIASCVGNIASRFFPKFDLNEAKRREILSAACAAGVSVSFGAPIGGTLFSLEEVSYYFPPRVMWRSFWCAMIAAASLRFLDPFGSGKIVLFAVTYDRDWHFFELVGFGLLGVLGGLYGAAFCKANIWWTKHVRNGTLLKRHPITEVVLVTFVTAIFSFSTIFTRMGGTELVFELFSECHREDSFDGLCVNVPDQVFGLLRSISYTWIIKALLTIVTFGIKVPAGIFIPSLAVGACFGRIAGLLVEYLYAYHPNWSVFGSCRAAFQDGPQPFGQACVLPGVWAMVGAAATLAGVTRTTVSLAVIMFELTGTLSYVVPVMLAVLVAKTVGDALEPRSIYDLVIELSNLPYLDDKTEYLHDSKPTEIMDTEALTICLDDDNTLDSLRHKLAKLYLDCTGAGFPITGRDSDGKERLYGYISSKELEHGLATYSILPIGTPVHFQAAVAVRQGVMPTRRPSRMSTPAGCDLSWLIETAPILVSDQAPMELVHEIFAKLGSRYLCIVDAHGYYQGVIERNRYLGYLQWLEKQK